MNINKVFVLVVIVIIILISGFIYFFYLEDPIEDNEEYHMTIKPEVRVTNNTYNQTHLSNTFWTTSIWDEFNVEYGGKYSENLRKEIIYSMKNQANDLGENPKVLERCIYATGQFDDPDNNRIPCLAEKAELEYYINHTDKAPYLIRDLHEFELGPKEIEPCWIIVINWGAPYEDFGHIKIFAISTIDFEILCYITCT